MMKQPDVTMLRDEYNSLVLIADGLLSMIQSCECCNLLTFSRMASEARTLARKIASMIEKLCMNTSNMFKRIALIAIDTIKDMILSLMNVI